MMSSKDLEGVYNYPSAERQRLKEFRLVALISLVMKSFKTDGERVAVPKGG